MVDKRRNPRNSESKLFRQLTRLLSGPIVNYRKQVPRKLKRRELDNFRFRSTSGQNFKKSAHNPYDKMQSNFFANQNRNERYVDFDQMEYTPEIASSLDIYADEMTTSTSLRSMMEIQCDNEEIKSVLEVLYHNVLNLEYNLFGWCRTMCKYGDFFLYLDIDDKDGIKYAVGLPPNEVERLEGEDKTNPNYIQFQWNSGGITFENWQISHFRILGNDKYSPYGTSVLEPARRIWRQLTLLEDAMMAYRIVRSPERRVFYIDVGNISPDDVEQYMQRVMTQMKRNQVVDVNDGRVDLRYNPMSIEEDYYIPVRGNQSSRIENLPGGTYTGDIDDVKYLRDKLFAALKIPASYLSRAEGSDEDKTTLAQKDIRFARTVQRLQRVVVSELEKIGVVHLFTIGYRGDDLLSFKLRLNNPSKIAELQELEHWRTKFDVAGAATEGFFSRQWISKNIFGMSEEQLLRIQREMFHDKKFVASLEKAVEAIASAPPPGAEGGGGAPPLPGPGGEAGMVPPAPGEAPPEEGGAPPEEGGGEAPPDDEGGMLLAAPGGGGAEGEEAPPPGKRDEEDWYKINRFHPAAHLSPNAKGKWYTPKQFRGGDRRPAGARRRQMISQGQSGYKDLKSLSYGIAEGLESTYDIQEKNILKNSREIEMLIERMESKEDEV